MSDWPAPIAASTLELELIATTTLGAPAATITFSGISTDYRIFEIVGWMLKDANAGQIGIRFNNDSAGNYTQQSIHADGATITPRRDAGVGTLFATIQTQSDANAAGSLHAIAAKPVSGERASLALLDSHIATNLMLVEVGGAWANTADLISRIDVVSVTNNLATGSRVSLGGAKAA